MLKDNKELRVNYNLLVDENSKVNKQNSEYRGLILENEQKLSKVDKDIQDFQKLVDLEKKQYQRLEEEKGVLEK